MDDIKSPLDLFKRSEKTNDKLNSLFSKETENVIERPIKIRTELPHKNEEEGRELEIDNAKAEESKEVEKNGEDEVKSKKKKSNKVQKQDENEDLESNYMEKYLENDDGSSNKKVDSKNAEDNDVEMKDSSEEPKIENKDINVHRAKSLDLQQVELLKAERTLFVGNLNAEIMSSKKLEKEFKKKFSEFGKIESSRFRSILFEEQIPKKAAFITKKFADTKDNVNCYIVYKEKDSIKKALSMNGKLLFDRHLRVDSVSHPFKKDNNRCIFIGNLDFFEVEESLWRFFENNNAGDIEYVRIVRDGKTNIGKGFAYVQFVEPVSVSKALTLNGKILDSFSTAGSDNDKKKKKGRALRITRAKRSNNDKKTVVTHNRSTKESYMKLTEAQKTKLGRAKTILNKKAKNEAGRFKKSPNVFVLEGARAQEGKGISIKNGKVRAPRVKKPRYTERSKNFRKLKEETKK